MTCHPEMGVISFSSPDGKLKNVTRPIYRVYIYTLIIIIIIVIKRTGVRRATPSWSVHAHAAHGPAVFDEPEQQRRGLVVVGTRVHVPFSESLFRSRQTYNRTHTGARFGNNNKIERKPRVFFLLYAKETVRRTRRRRMTTPSVVIWVVSGGRKTHCSFPPSRTDSPPPGFSVQMNARAENETDGR